MMLPFITACSTVVSDDTQSYCLVLPNVKKYNKQFLAEVAEEIKQNKAPYSKEMLKDFKVMRDETRIAEKEYCNTM